MSKTSAFSLNQKISIAATGQKGTVIGASLYVHDASRYWVNYVNGQGDLVAEWFLEDDLQETTEDTAVAA